MTLRTLALAATLLAAPALAEPLEPRTTPGGHAFTHVALPDAPFTALGLVWPSTAAVFVPGKEGLAILSGKLPLERAGTRDFDTLNEELDDTGEGLALSSGLSTTVMNLFAPADGTFAVSSEIAADILDGPDFTAEDLARVQRDIADNLIENARAPQDMLLRAMGAYVANGDERLAAITNRPVSSVTSVTLDDLAAWHEATFHAAPIIVSAGPMDAGDVAEAIDRMLADVPATQTPGAPAPLVDLRAGGTIAVAAPGTDQALILAATPIVESSAGVMVAQMALAGRPDAILFATLREALGATYGVQPGAIPTVGDQKLITLSAQVPPSRAGEALGVMRDTLARVRGEGLSEEEFAAAKETAAAALADMARHPMGVMPPLLGEALMGRPLDPQALADALAALDRETLNASLQTLLAPEPTLVAVTPAPEAVPGACVVETPEDAAGC